jgi:hypothetical protein
MGQNFVIGVEFGNGVDPAPGQFVEAQGSFFPAGNLPGQTNLDHVESERFVAAQPLGAERIGEFTDGGNYGRNIPGVLCVGCLAYLVLSKAAGQSIPALRWLAWGGMGGFGAIAYSLWRGK